MNKSLIPCLVLIVIIIIPLAISMEYETATSPKLIPKTTAVVNNANASWNMSIANDTYVPYTNPINNLNMTGKNVTADYFLGSLDPESDLNINSLRADKNITSTFGTLWIKSGYTGLIVTDYEVLKVAQDDEFEPGLWEMYGYSPGLWWDATVRGWAFKDDGGNFYDLKVDNIIGDGSQLTNMPISNGSYVIQNMTTNLNAMANNITNLSAINNELIFTANGQVKSGLIINNTINGSTTAISSAYGTLINNFIYVGNANSVNQVDGYNGMMMKSTYKPSGATAGLYGQNLYGLNVFVNYSSGRYVGSNGGYGLTPLNVLFYIENVSTGGASMQPSFTNFQGYQGGSSVLTSANGLVYGYSMYNLSNISGVLTYFKPSITLTSRNNIIGGIDIINFASPPTAQTNISGYRGLNFDIYPSNTINYGTKILMHNYSDYTHWGSGGMSYLENLTVNGTILINGNYTQNGNMSINGTEFKLYGQRMTATGSGINFITGYVRAQGVSGGYGFYVDNKASFRNNITNDQATSMVRFEKPVQIWGNFTSTAPCNVTYEGGIYYNFNAKKHYGCDGTNWNALY